MTRDIFTPADILLPGDGVRMETWSVIACDQFSSEKEYWERVRDKVGEDPSTLGMIIPEAYLAMVDEENEAEKICKAMDSYTERGLMREVGDSFVYVERTLPDGRVRRGLVGAVDLEEYDFSGGEAAILASEGTVLERLPARVRIRRRARLELPHIMVFIDDKENTVIEPLASITGELPLLYDFELMESGGSVRGRRVHGVAAEGVLAALRALHAVSDPLMVLGDGNHSLAAAKVYWDELKQGLNEAERKTHPAGRALLEINNVYDGAIDFEAIHRVVFNVAPEALLSALKDAIPDGSDYMLRWISRGQSGAFGVSAGCIGDMLSVLQTFLDGYAYRTGCTVDYIHGEDATVRLAEGDGCLGLLLPAMDKSELFATVKSRGVFPKKSFSVGHARDKRYYLECRGIR